MASQREQLLLLDKEELVNRLLKNESKLELVQKELQLLKVEVKANNELRDRIVSLERASYASEQYSRRDSVEFNGLPDCISDDNLESKVVEILDKIGVKVNPRLKYKYGSIGRV